MSNDALEPVRKPRADSLRNRERLLQAAREVFSAGGEGASLEAVAREAGLGIGTLYRHFPTREALFRAVYQRDVDELVSLAARLSETDTPAEALRAWVHANVRMVATKRGMLTALSPVLDKSDSFYSSSAERMVQAMARLMRQGIDAGQIRDDIPPEEVMRAMLAICYTPDQAGWQETVTRLLDVFVDGLSRR